MEKLTSPLIGLCFLQRNVTILDMRQGVSNFLFSMQLKTTDHKHNNVTEHNCTREVITFPSNDWHIFKIHPRLYVDTAVTEILQPSFALSEDSDIPYCAALVTLTIGQATMHMNNFTDHPYTCIVNFSFLTPERMKYGKHLDTETTWHPLQDNPEMAAFNASTLIKSS